MMNVRAAGVLLPVFSLPDKYGIGSMGKEAYKFVDFLKKAGQKYWQILPLGPTGYGDSPYQSFSTFAGNPYFIDINEFIQRGYITAAMARKVMGKPSEYIDYEKLYYKRYELLKLAYANSKITKDKGFKAFCQENSFWLDDYALFMALKDSNDGKAWTQWDTSIRNRETKALVSAAKKHLDTINFYKFLQYFFKLQWSALKAYANEKGISIIGDIPIYVAFDSSDVWAGAELFDLDEEHLPNAVAGCPPDPFAATGQLWGNPLYDWKYHKSTGYEWWIRRIKNCFELYDVVRIDHFRGFDEYYAIPYGDPTAEFGKWRKGPGYDLFKAIKDALGEKKIIAEDLGFLTDSVRKLVKKTGYPGMKVLQFAFDSDNRSEYLPHMLGANSVIYTGTHDNETFRGWYNSQIEANPKAREYFDDYTGCGSEAEAAAAAIRLALASVCETAIVPMQDYLNIDNRARINKPATLGNNWNWQMKSGLLTAALAKEMKKLLLIYGRD